MSGDSKHEIVRNVELLGGAVLHRFKNAAGVSYSAIYVDGYEVASQVREREQPMVDWWNEWKKVESEAACR